MVVIITSTGICLGRVTRRHTIHAVYSRYVSTAAASILTLAQTTSGLGSIVMKFVVRYQV